MTVDALHMILGLAVLVLGGLLIRAKRAPAASCVPAIKIQTAEKITTEKPDAALQWLSILQKEARLVDFFQQELTGFSDADVGVAARLVHEGGRRTLHSYFDLVPIRSEAENTRVTIESGFDPQAIRLTGRVVGEAPFKGLLIHRGWRVTASRLPQCTENHDASIIAPAEVEL